MSLDSLQSPEVSSTTTWLIMGFVAQGIFGARFLVQWVASERARRSVVPHAFWYLSLLGGTLLLVYAIHRRDPVFILGQLSGVLIYSRNLWLLRNGKGNAQPLAS